MTAEKENETVQDCSCVKQDEGDVKIYGDGILLAEADNVTDINGINDNEGKGNEVYGLFQKATDVAVISLQVKAVNFRLI